MDVLIRKRGALRGAFTKAADSFVQQLKCDTAYETLRPVFDILQDKKARLVEVDESIHALLLADDDEEKYQKDFLESELYKDRFLTLRAKMEACKVTPVVSAKSSRPAFFNFSKLTPRTFDVSPKTWCHFWGQFRNVHEDSGITDEDKFQYLLQNLRPGTAAHRIVESYPPLGGNYENAFNHLRRRFGRDDLVIDASVREILNVIVRKGNLGLGELVDLLGTHIRTLKALGVGSDKFELFLYPLLEKCLPTDILQNWLLSEGNVDSDCSEMAPNDSGGVDVSINANKLVGKVEKLMSFLERQVESKEHVAEISGDLPKSTATKGKKDEGTGPTAAALHSGEQQVKRPQACVFCDGTSHGAMECKRALQMTVPARREVVKTKGACFACLFRGHAAYNCRRPVTCVVCQRRHPAIICAGPEKEQGRHQGAGGGRREGPQQQQQRDYRGPQSGRGNRGSVPDQNSTACSSSSQEVVYLKTLKARVVGKYGNSREVRIFVDDGAQRSYITTGLAQELGLEPVEEIYMTHGLWGGYETERRRHYVYEVNMTAVSDHSKRDGNISFTVVGQQKLCHDMPHVSDQKLLADLRQQGVELSDVSAYARVSEVDIMLGSDMLSKVLTGKLQVLPSGLVATETVFGWCLQGIGGKKVVNSICLSLHSCSREVTDLWDLDTLGIEAPEKTSDGEEALAHFKETVTVNGEGRYVVSLPWRAGHPPLPTNRDIATSRLYRNTERLEKLQLFKKYDGVLQSWLEDGVIERAPPREGVTHYLPHQAVIKPQSRTTPIRPVFDASVAKPGAASLNQCLDKGPNLIPLLLPILLKFRMGLYGVSADIKQAFLMMEVNTKDRDVLRFLWWDGDKVVEFRHCRVVFGVASSPFLLNASLQHLLNEKHPSLYAETVDRLKGAFYVDNCLTSVDTKEELLTFQQQAKEILATRKFQLRDWMSNAVELRECDSLIENVLGVKWLVDVDALAIALPKERVSNSRLTKRQLLSVCNSIFDPLGVLAGVLLVPKSILQETWRLKLDWDQELPSPLERRFLDWCKSLHMVELCTIPRCMMGSTGAVVTLHIFCDATATAYAACAFLRIGAVDAGGAELRFVMAKARVGPVEALSIPRMELMGACVAARMHDAVISSVGREFKSHFWTDSAVVLCWISRMEPWKTFVGNRVSEIRKLTNKADWRHVPGSLNPADLLSRGTDCAGLVKRQWLSGPEWLCEPESSWPSGKAEESEEAAFEERKRVLVSADVPVQEKISSRLTSFFSKYTKIVNMVAWMKRFTFNARNPLGRRKGKLSACEIEEAERALFKVVQDEWPEESRKKGGLRMYRDEDGLLRVKTKLVFGDDSLAFQEPLVLTDNPIVRRLIEHIHVKSSHAGVQTTLMQLREKVWLLKGRKVTRQVVSKCVVCRRQDSKPIVPIEAPLPIDRFSRVASFQVTGVDCAGPLFLKKQEKAWIVLFTCAVYRAVHLELVTSLSTEAFLQAVRRMMARRGPVSVFWCDNGSNFVGASNALAELDWDDVAAQGAAQRIHFRFICPASPWFGGWWEVMVKLTKRLLRKCLGKAYLTYEELSTVLCDCESTLNSRPLTYVSEDENELRPLTPAMFIYEPREDRGEVLDAVDSKSLNKRVRYVQEVRSQLKERFRQEYLSQLVHFKQNKKPGREMSVGDIVLVGAENTKRMEWPLARILEIFVGNDGETRVAKVRTACGELLRPLKKLYPLEVHHEQDAGESVVLDGDVPGDETLSDEDGSEHSMVTMPPPGPTVNLTKRGREVKKPVKLNL